MTATATKHADHEHGHPEDPDHVDHQPPHSHEPGAEHHAS